MARWKRWFKKAVEIILDGSNHVCMVCGDKVAHAVQCEACGVVACDGCHADGTCPNCGEPL